MTRSTHRHSDPNHKDDRFTRRDRRRRQHLRHIHPMTREQQLTLIEEARAARRAANQTAEAADPWAPTMERDQEWAYGNGWGKIVRENPGFSSIN